ncbi:protein kinase, putative [Leishmania tarentolae]|uniref:Protein kinase, putative n=1 Tax=Leishmania tarentolae TaxID=5689 RepID=A0A640KUP9_LEITA|nr:protein kinase, putative [Leishmania tarentolae]
MAHRDCDAISPHSPRSQPRIPSWHIGEQKNAIDQSSVHPAEDVGSGAVGPPHQSVMHDGGGNITPFLSARHTQQKCENNVEICWASPTKVVDSNVNVSIPCGSRTSLDSAITPPSTRQVISERSSPASGSASTLLVRKNDACGSAQPLDKASTCDGGLIGVQGHSSLSGSVVDPCSNRGGELSQNTDDAPLSNISCHAPVGIGPTPLDLPFPQVTLSRHLHSTQSTSADGVGTSAGSHDTPLLSKGGTSGRRCYVPKRGSHAHSNTLIPDGSGGMRRALLSPTLRTTAQANRVSTPAQKELPHGAETSYMRASLLSLTSDTASTSEDTSRTRVQQHDERMKCHLSLLPPLARTSTLTLAKATEHVSHGPGKHTSARATSSAPMAPSLMPVEPRPLAPSSLTCNPLTQTPQFSEGRLGEHEVEPSQLHDENAPSAASTPLPRYGDQRLALLRGCAATRGKASRTPPIAVLVPLPPESAEPAPTPAPARKTSSPPMKQLESDTYEVNANSLTSERGFHCRERPSQRQQQRHPASALEPRTSVSVSPHHPFLSLVYLPTPKPERPQSTPARSSPPENGDPTLLEYVASLKPPESSFSVCRGLLCVGVALCAVPLCAAILLFSLNYWAVTSQEKNYVEAVPHSRRGAGLAPHLALLLSILLSIVVMGGGSGVAIYFVLYRLAIRYQVRAFALCVQLADGLSALETHELAAEDSGGRYDSVMPIDAAAMAAHRAANDNDLAKRVSPFVARWHEEVSRLVNQLTCPIEVSHPEWRSFGFSERRRLSFLNEGANGGGDRLATGTMLTDGPCCNSNNSHVLPFGAQSSALMAENELWPPQGALPTSRYLMSEAIFSRRPHHPVELSKRQEAVTVVVCRFMEPAELLVQQGPLTQVQLKELQRLSNEFHQRLRTVPRTSYAAITEVGVCEVVFSFNTVSPLPSLVASPAAVSLAVVAHKALVDWSPTYFDTPVQWGIAVHRFDAYMCPTRGMHGRLHLSFGTLEYDFARLLAELAALLNYGALCHAGFLADASCESQCLPVDYVMDLRQQAFLVYQLHDGAVDREQRLQMNKAIAAMRNGQYKAAVDSLGAWKRKRSGCGGLPMPAAHLQYVAGFLECAARKGRPRALDVKEEVGNASSFTCAIEGVAEWAAESLLTSYFRPPPVWEEEEAPQVPSPDLLRAPSTVAPRRGGKCGLRARECGVHNAVVPSSPQPLRGATGEMATLFGSLMRRSYRARISYALFAQQQEGQVGSKDMEAAPYQPGEVSAAIEGNTRPRRPSQGSAGTPSPGTDSFSRGNLVDEGSASLLPRNTVIGFSSSSPATHSDFEMSTSNTTFGDVTSGDRKWATLALLTEADQSTVTVNPSRTHLYSSSWSLAESGVPEMPNLTPLTSGVLWSSQVDVRRQRHASILLPGVKKESEAAGTVAASASIQDTTTLRSARGRRESSGGKMEWPRGRNVSQFTTDVPTSDDLSSRLLGHRGVSQLTDISIARFPSEGSHDSLSVRSGSVRRRASASTAAASSILPLFADSPAPLFLQDRVESLSGTEAASEADLNDELSMVSVAQRSRSRRSHRSTAQPSSVVCFCTRRIDNHSSNAVMVFQGFHPDGYLVVVKRADRGSVKEVAQLRNEVDLLRELHHRNIVNIVSAWKDDHAVYFAMEYACETLTTVLQKFKVLLPGVVRFYTRELLNALVYLHHDCGIIHRDLSPNNVIITNTTDRSRVKLIDFGRSIMAPHFCSGSNGTSITVAGNSSVELAERRSSRNKVSVFDVPTSVVGTPLFMSPQACRGLAHPTNDIWSLGIIVHLCLTGTYPYPPESFTDPETFIANIGSGWLAPAISDAGEMTGEARNFVEQCLTLSHTERPSAAALLKHSFVER